MPSLRTIRTRVAALLTGVTYGYTAALSPFSFDLQPSGAIDQVFRIEASSGAVVGCTNYTEQRTDFLEIWLARRQGPDTEITYQTLIDDSAALRASVIRDGTSGDYDVPDGGASLAVQHGKGQEYAVLRLVVPVNYEVSV